MPPRGPEDLDNVGEVGGVATCCPFSPADSQGPAQYTFPCRPAEECNGDGRRRCTTPGGVVFRDCRRQSRHQAKQEGGGMVGRVLSISFVVFLVLVVLVTSGIVNKERAAFMALEWLPEPVGPYVVPRAFELLRLAALLLVCVVVLWASANSSRLDDLE